MNRKKQSSSAPASASNEERSRNEAASSNVLSEEERIMSECESAISIFQNGDQAEALRLMKQLTTRHQSYGYLHYIQSCLLFSMATSVEDHSVSPRCLKAAVESARQAALLEPNFIDLADLYAYLLYLAADDSKGYQEVVRECERALSNRSATVGLEEGNFSEYVEHLQSLIERSKNAMKNPVNRTLDKKIDTLPIKSGNNAKPNVVRMEMEALEKREEESKKAEETAKILMRLVESNRSQVEPLALGSSPKQEDKRKSSSDLKRIASSAGKMSQVRKYWESISTDQKRAVLNMRISDLIEAHLGSTADNMAMATFLEAIDFAEKNRTWKFLLCCCCGEKFKDFDPYLKHVKREHLEDLPIHLRAVIPEQVNNDRIEMILHGNWKPVDVSAALKITENGLKGTCNSLDLSQDYCTEDSLESYFKEKEVGNPNDQEGVNHERISNFGSLPEHEGNQLSNASPYDHKWPLTDDSERANILVSIHDMLKLLLRCQYLAERILKVVIDYSLENLQELIPISKLRIHGLDQIPLCVCLLECSQLKYIFEFLLNLISSDLEFPSEESKSLNKTPNGGFDIKYRIGLSGCSLSFLLDKQFPIVDNFTYQDTIADDGSAVAFTTDELEDDVLLNSALVPWLFAGSSIGEQLALWTSVRKVKRNQGIEILCEVTKKYSHFGTLCQRKLQFLLQEDAFQAIETTFHEELEKRNQISDFVPQSYEFLLKKRHEELLKRNHDFFSSDMAELLLIRNILKDAEALTVNRVDENLSYGTSHLEDDEEYECKMLQNLLQADILMEFAVRKQRYVVSLELCKIELRMEQAGDDIVQLGLNLGRVSTLDYRLIIIIFLKTFMRERLEDLAKKEATAKADAVVEELLAETTLDAKKNINTTGGNTKHLQKKSRKKKNKKCSKDAKDLKATDETKQLLLHKDAEQGVFPVAFDGDCPNSDIGVSASDVELKQQEEEESRLKARLEAEARKLDEALAYQKRIETECRLKGHAELFQNVELVEKISPLHNQNGEIDGRVPPLSENQNVELGDSRKFTGKPDTLPNSQSRISFTNENKPFSDSSENNFKEPEVLSSTSLSSSEENVAKQEHLTEQNKVARRTEILPIPKKCVVEMPVVCTRPSDTTCIGRNLLVGLPFSEKSVFSENDGRPGVSNQLTHCKTISLPDSDSFADSSNETDGGGFNNQVSADNQNVELVDPRQVIVHRVAFSNDEKPDENTLVGKSGHPRAPSGVPLSTSEGNSVSFICPSSSVSHNGGISEGGLLPSDQWKGNQDTLQSLRDSEVLQTDVRINHMDRSDVCNTSLKDDVDQYNCFLSVIIKALWHLKQFRNELLSRASAVHTHVGPCVFCSLYNTFTASRFLPMCPRQTVVTPSPSKIALSNLYPETNFSQEAQTNDASELLAAIFDCLHQSFTLSSGYEPEESNSRSCWECPNDACLTHSVFGMDILERMNCYNCGLESRNRKHTSFFHYINASTLRTMKILCMDSSFDKLLKHVEVNDLLACDPAAGGCGNLNHVHHILSTPPHVFTAVLCWQTACERAEDISAVLTALSTEIDIGILYGGFNGRNKHYLVSLICFSRKSYQCFAYSRELEKWILYGEEIVKVIGCWDNVITLCKARQLQPQILFFEDEKINHMNRSDICNGCLKDDVDQYNCFLNVIIKSLWHLKQFRNELLSRGSAAHTHIDPCVFCSLYNTFTASRFLPLCPRQTVVTSSPCKMALSNLYPESNFSQEAQTNDASELLAAIFDFLHQSFTISSGTEPEESNSRSCWECPSDACLTHTVFGMDILERMNCYNCGLESRNRKYTSFFHYINASSLRTMKILCMDSSFDKLLKHVGVNDLSACDPAGGGCGKLNPVHHILSNPPHVFTAVLCWQSASERAEDISAVLTALSTEIDIGILYGGFNGRNKHYLISLICFSGKIYHCFAYSRELEKWILYDKEIVEVMGCWDDVITLCKARQLQPQILFFEDEK